MMNKKTIDKKTQTSETSSKTKDGSKKDIRPEKKGNNKLKSFLKSEMTHFITGLIILMFGAFLSLAFLSFFFTGDADQSSLENLPLSQLTDVKNEINNWTGYFGAYLADLFINRWVGISAFFFCIIFVSTG